MNLKDFYKEFRNNRTITIINVVGYSIALASCLVIGLFVYNQFTFDTFNENSERIYRLNYTQNQKNTNSAVTNHQWEEVLPKEIPGIEKAARFGWSYEGNIEFEKNNFKAKGAYGDKELFEIFSFTILQRENKDFFEKPMSIALSKSLAQKIFGKTTPIGKTLKLDHRQEYTVTAIFDDIPSNTSLEFQFLTNVNDALIEIWGKEMEHHWLVWWVRTFVLVNDKSAVADFGRNMKALQKKYVGDWYAETSDYYLQPLEQIHLHSAEIDGSFDTDISITLIYIFSSAGLLILVISCINYINLSVAGFESRKKSVGIKKIIGAGRSYLFRQYLSYSVLLTFLCILIAFLISFYIIPVLKTQGISGIDIPINKPLFWLIVLFFGLLTGILSGLYPAGYISKTVITANPKASKSRSVFSNGLITIQFSIAIILLVSIVTIRKQLNESTKGDLGYNYSSLISFGSTEEIFNHYSALHDEIGKIPGVISYTSCGFEIPGYLGNFWPVQPEGAEKLDIFHTSVAPNFFEALGIPIRNKFGVLREDTASASDRAIINDEAVKKFGIGETVVGKTYKLGETSMEITGISGDFHIGSMRDLIKPIHFTIMDKNWNQLIRLEKANQDNAIAQIQKVWEKFETVAPFAYRFVDHMIAEQYSKEKSLLKLFNVFFVLAMIISLIGLFGLVQLLLRFRVKEIGIRKVNGAKVLQVMTMLNKEFIKWVIIAFVIACPIAWYIMHRWLQSFAYKTDMSWWIFIAAGAATMVVAMLTVSWQSWRAATRNPVESLRHE
jgi:ABC-type antimicrobial peptide transport system permease subunit